MACCGHGSCPWTGSCGSITICVARQYDNMLQIRKRTDRHTQSIFVELLHFSLEIACAWLPNSELTNKAVATVKTNRKSGSTKVYELDGQSEVHSNPWHQNLSASLTKYGTTWGRIPLLCNHQTDALPRTAMLSCKEIQSLDRLSHKWAGSTCGFILCINCIGCTLGVGLSARNTPQCESLHRLVYAQNEPLCSLCRCG